MCNVSAVFNTFNVHFVSHSHGNIQPYSEQTLRKTLPDLMDILLMVLTLLWPCAHVIDESFIKGIRTVF